MGASSDLQLCFRCGADLAGMLPGADAQGHTLCETCAHAQLADDGTIPIAPMEETGKTRIGCPTCGKPLPLGSNTCTACHAVFKPPPENKRATFGVGRLSGKPSPCRHCGYDLTGVVAEICPECGERIARSRRDHLEAHSNEVAREAYVRPLIYLGVGLTLTLLLYLATSWKVSLGYLLVFPFRVGTCVVVYAFAAYLWMGFDYTWRLMAVNLAAAMVASDAVLALADLITPLPMLADLTLALLAFAGILYDLLDIDLEDGMLLGGLCWIFSIVLWGVVYVVLK